MKTISEYLEKYPVGLKDLHSTLKLFQRLMSQSVAALWFPLIEAVFLEDNHALQGNPRAQGLLIEVFSMFLHQQIREKT